MNIRTTLPVVALAALGLAIPAARVSATGTTITDDGGSYTAGVNDISQLSYTNSSDGRADYTDNYTPGQTFFTGSNSLGYTLNSLTLKATGSAGNFQDDSTVTVRIENVGPTNSNGYTTLTPFATFTAPTASLLNTSDFFTFNLAVAPVHLAAGTAYAFDFQSANPGGTYYLGTDKSSGDAYSGGTAFNEEYYNGSSIRYPQSYDRTFDLGLTPDASAAPEPSQLAGLGFTVLGALGLMLKARKRTVGRLGVSA